MPRGDDLLPEIDQTDTEAQSAGSARAPGHFYVGTEQSLQPSSEETIYIKPPLCLKLPRSSTLSPVAPDFQDLAVYLADGAGVMAVVVEEGAAGATCSLT